MNQVYLTIFTITLPLIGAGIGYLIKYNIEKKKELTNGLTIQRREIYQQFVNLIIDLFANTKLNKPSNNLLKNLFEFYKKYVLFASPNVIKAFSDYFQSVYNPADGENDSKKSLELITKIMLEMRRDLGLDNTGLGNNGEMLMRALITDYHKIWK